MSKLKSSSKLSQEEKEVTAKFVDTFVSCSLEIEDLAETVQEVQQHTHTKTCRKYGTTCRFGYPKFPSNRTIIAQPLKKENFPSKRAYNNEKKRLKEILEKVKEVLTELDEEENLTSFQILSW